MKTLSLLTWYQLTNLLRARWPIVYALLFFFLGCGWLYFAGDPSKALAGISNTVLFITPIIAVLYASISWYNSSSFTYLLLSQPFKRSHVFLANWISVSLGLTLSLVLGMGLAFLFYHSLSVQSLAVLFFGAILTVIFVALGSLIAVAIDDPMKGVGISFLMWFYFALLHDVLVFAVLSLFVEYPVEIPAILLMVINPIDLVRVHLLLILDMAAMMGYTGKILQSFLSGTLGQIFTLTVQLLWVIVPLSLAVHIFSRKDQ
jgi:Cu-processing system permease protein